TRSTRDWSADVCSSDLDGGQAAREGQLQPYQPRQHQSHQSNRERSDRILDGDDFGVLAKNVFRHPALRMIEFYVFHFGGWDDSRSEERRVGKECRMRGA